MARQTGSEGPGEVAIYDVAVVGAGPAGSAAALAALRGRPDARVLLLDRSDFPRDKACGDGIAPHGIDVLRGLGVTDATAGYDPVAWIHVRSPGGVEVVGRPRRANWVIPRTVFDARLVAAAVARGAEFRRHRVRRLEQRDGYVLLDGEMPARVVVGADGANSTVRRLLGLPGSPPEHTAIAVRGYAAAPGTDRPEYLIAMVAAGWPAYAWSFPIGDGRANVGFGKLLPHLGADSSGGRAELHGRLAALLPDQPATDLRAHHLPLSSGAVRQPDGRVLLVGDAASLINPLTGEGIYYALESGRRAGAAAVATGGRPAAAYRQAMRRTLGRHLRHTRAVFALARRPGFVDAAATAAARDDRVFQAIVELGLANGTIPAPLAVGVVRHGVRGRLSRSGETRSD